MAKTFVNHQLQGAKNNHIKELAKIDNGEFRRNAYHIIEESGVKDSSDSLTKIRELVDLVETRSYVDLDAINNDKDIPMVCSISYKYSDGTNVKFNNINAFHLPMIVRNIIKSLKSHMGQEIKLDIYYLS